MLCSLLDQAAVSTDAGPAFYASHVSGAQQTALGPGDGPALVSHAPVEAAKGKQLAEACALPRACCVASTKSQIRISTKNVKGCVKVVEIFPGGTVLF